MKFVDKIGPIEIFRHKKNHFVLHNTNKRFKNGHVHLKSSKRAFEVAQNVIDKHFPLHWSNYFIESMIRLSTDKIFIERLKHLRRTRKGKERNYRNSNV